LGSEAGSGWEGHHFVVGEPLVGFPVKAAPWTKTAKRYCLFKDRVRLLANVAGVPSEIPEGKAVVLCIAVSWKRKARIDGSNIVKAIEDGLFKKDRGVEKVLCDRFEHTGLEEASVIVTFKERLNGKQNKDAKGNLARNM